MSVQVRLARPTPEDRAGLHGLYAALALEGWPLQRELDEIESDFPRFLARLRESELGIALPVGIVPQTLYLALLRLGGREVVAGRLSLRHRLTPSLRERGGHIGYAVHPDYRGRGVASTALGLGLKEAAGLGLERVLLTCDEANPASHKVIERNGGVLEDMRRDPQGVKYRRYWIDVPQPATVP